MRLLTKEDIASWQSRNHLINHGEYDFDTTEPTTELSITKLERKVLFEKTGNFTTGYDGFAFFNPKGIYDIDDSPMSSDDYMSIYEMF